MERRGRLTYERLINSLERLHNAVGAQFPDLEDAGRAQDLQRIINDTLTTARAGMGGASVAFPAQMKQDVKARIAEIHERYDKIDGTKKHAATGTHVDAFSSSAAIGIHASSLSSTQKSPAPKRTRRTSDSGKENATPPAAPAIQLPARTMSAVKKTKIAKRAPSSKPSTTAGVIKRPARPTRSKPTTEDTTATPLSTTDEADRCAAAAALLGLAEYSPDTSFTSLNSSSTNLTPSITGKKRAHSAYTDDTPFHHAIHPQVYVSSSSAPKRHVLAPGMYGPVPVLDKKISVQHAFSMGVEYAVRHLSTTGGFEGEKLRAWVVEELGLRSATLLDERFGMHRSNADDGMPTDRAAVDRGNSVVDGGKKSFWNVV